MTNTVRGIWTAQRLGAGSPNCLWTSLRVFYKESLYHLEPTIWIGCCIRFNVLGSRICCSSYIYLPWDPLHESQRSMYVKGWHWRGAGIDMLRF